MKRTYPIGSIQIVLFILFSDDINGSTQSVCSQAGRNDSFINLDPVNNIDRQICEGDTASFCGKGHAVDKVTNGITGHPVDGKIEVRTDTTFFPDFDAGCSVYYRVQVIQWIDGWFYIQCIYCEYTLFYLLALGFAIYFDGIQVYSTFFKYKILFFTVSEVYVCLDCFIAYIRNSNRIFSGREG